MKRSLLASRVGSGRQDCLRWSESSSIKVDCRYRVPPGRLARNWVISPSTYFPLFFHFFLRPYLYECSCPVCSQNLAELGPASAQEAHVKNCLDGGSGISPQTSKYLVYKLPGESALIGTECMRYLSVISETIWHILAQVSFVWRNLWKVSRFNLIYSWWNISHVSIGSMVARLSCLCSFHNGEFSQLCLWSIDELMFVI